MDESPEKTTETPSPDPLSPVEARVLGCLIEKELATPEYYPLTLNALVNACNQKSNRNPFLALTSRDVELALDSLRHRHLAGMFSGADARVPKFKQTIDQVYPMETADRVVLCELLVRGPQTNGELRGRCDRLHPFADLAGIEAAIDRLATRAAGPLVTTLPRQTGRKEPRHAQLLTGTPDLTELAEKTSTEASSSPAAPLTVAIRLPPEAEERFAALETEVTKLRAELDTLRSALGVTDGDSV